MSANEKKIIKFSDVKDRIIEALKANKIDLDKHTLFEGFISEPFSKELSDSITIGGPTIPMILLVNNQGKIELYALKALVSDLW